ncbi:carboxylesterase family protein [Streptomyces zhihengii]
MSIRPELPGFACAAPWRSPARARSRPPSVLAGLPSNPGFPYGAAHGFEMPYLFSALPTERPLSDARRALSDRMVDYWTAFARTGSPNAPGLPR